MTELREKPDFERVYSEYKEKVARYVHGKIANAHDVEDVVSDVFVKVFNGLDGFDGNKASLSTWIYTVTRNTVTDHFRALKNRSCGLPDDLCSADDIEQSILSGETLEILADALASLGERERDIIVLHYYGGRTLVDIARTMGISYSYTKLFHSNALKALKKFFRE